ncbi:hypothetical protein AB990_03305 [Alkalihalobacillus pseudalcaliphilus]|nr:hypothetical protein AB990_03305 [Alkalihalobacillus pseudalcaliphilus]
MLDIKQLKTFLDACQTLSLVILDLSRYSFECSATRYSKLASSLYSKYDMIKRIKLMLCYTTYLFTPIMKKGSVHAMKKKILAYLSIGYGYSTAVFF